MSSSNVNVAVSSVMKNCSEKEQPRAKGEMDEANTKEASSLQGIIIAPSLVTDSASLLNPASDAMAGQSPGGAFRRVVSKDDFSGEQQPVDEKREPEHDYNDSVQKDGDSTSKDVVTESDSDDHESTSKRNDLRVRVVAASDSSGGASASGSSSSGLLVPDGVTSEEARFRPIEADAEISKLADPEVSELLMQRENNASFEDCSYDGDSSEDSSKREIACTPCSYEYSEVLCDELETEQPQQDTASQVEELQQDEEVVEANPENQEDDKEEASQPDNSSVEVQQDKPEAVISQNIMTSPPSTPPRGVPAKECYISLKVDRPVSPLAVESDTFDPLPCACGRREECNGISGAFFMLNDERAGYVQAPDFMPDAKTPFDVETNRLRNAILKPFMTTAPRAGEYRASEQYVANHHFHPQVLSSRSETKGATSCVPTHLSTEKMASLNVGPMDNHTRVLDEQGNPTDLYYVVPSYGFHETKNDLINSIKSMRNKLEDSSGPSHDEEEEELEESNKAQDLAAEEGSHGYSEADVSQHTVIPQYSRTRSPAALGLLGSLEEHGDEMKVDSECDDFNNSLFHLLSPERDNTMESDSDVRLCVTVSIEDSGTPACAPEKGRGHLNGLPVDDSPQLQGHERNVEKRDEENSTASLQNGGINNLLVYYPASYSVDGAHTIDPLPCACGNIKECNGISAAFFLLQDERGCYVKVPEYKESAQVAVDLESNRLRKALLQPFESPEGGSVENSGAEQYVAIHHFHPEFMSMQSTKGETSVLPTHIPKPVFTRLEMGSTNHEPVLDDKGRSTSFHYVVPNYNTEKTRNDLRSIIQSRRTKLQS